MKKAYLTVGLMAALALGGIGLISANYVEAKNRAPMNETTEIIREREAELDTSTSATEKGQKDRGGNGEFSAGFGDGEFSGREKPFMGEDGEMMEGMPKRGKKRFEDLNDEEKAEIEERMNGSEMPERFGNGTRPENAPFSNGSDSGNSKSESAQKKGQPTLPDAFDSEKEV